METLVSLWARAQSSVNSYRGYALRRRIVIRLAYLCVDRGEVPISPLLESCKLHSLATDSGRVRAYAEAIPDLYT
jgi:hypothetical protein